MTTSSGAPRVDPSTKTVVHVVGARQNRPNLPTDVCPFCVGGIEAPEQYSVKWFPNRWPAMPNERCEVVLYSPDHHQSFAGLGMSGAREVLDLWADRTSELGQREDVEHVLIFENRGRDVGATIDHPHGQIYAFDHVPARTAARVANNWAPQTTSTLLVTGDSGWTTSVPFASAYPVALEIAPNIRVGTLDEMDDQQRNGCAAALIDALTRMQQVFSSTIPYMLWVNQRPTTNRPEHANAWLNIEIVSPWRATNVLRYIAAAEVSTNEYFNPLIPEELAGLLRDARASQ